MDVRGLCTDQDGLQQARKDLQGEPQVGETIMGNSESGCGAGSGDEDDIETESPGFAEDNPASAATGGCVVGGGGTGGSGRSGRGSNNLPAPTGGPPGPGVLLEQVKLREAAARISLSGVAIRESVLSGNEGVLTRWLEDRVNRGEETVNVEQFCEMLESRDAPRDECEEVHTQGEANLATVHLKVIIPVFFF